MRHSLEPKYKKHVQDYGFSSFARKFGDKYGKKLMNTATKTGIDAAKTVFKRIVQETAEAIENLIGNKTADGTTLAGKSKNKEKEDETNETEEICIPSEKRQQIIDDFRLF